PPPPPPPPFFLNQNPKNGLLRVVWWGVIFLYDNFIEGRRHMFLQAYFFLHPVLGAPKPLGKKITK
ncbi:hypothetical protein ACVGXF_00260, partial [Enterobacter hormaechei]